MIKIEKAQRKTEIALEAINKPFSVVIIDIDFLIRYCIKFPGKTCNKIMKKIKNFINSEFNEQQIIHIRNTDEFFIIFNNDNINDVYVYVNSVLKKFRKQKFLSFVNGYRNIRITFSAGIASSQNESNNRNVCRKAFIALFTAKSLRRNNVIKYDDSFDENKERKLLDHKIKISPIIGEWGKVGRTTLACDADLALLWEPQAIAAGSDGRIYIADQNNHQILMYDGVNVQSILGNGKYGGYKRYRLNKPTGLCVFGNNLYITDTGNDMVLKFDLITGELLHICGMGEAGFSGDCGPKREARLNKPGGIVVDKYKNIYINDIANNRIRKISRDGFISTFAGNGCFGFAGDFQTAETASFNEIYAICIDAKGENIYAADYHNYRIRRINVDTHIISTIAGNGTCSYSGDGGRALDACLNRPVAVCTDNYGNIYIAESGSHSVRVVTNEDDRIYTLAGGIGMGTGIKEDVSSFKLANPNSLCCYKNILYILDGANNRVCKINLTEE